MLGAILLDNHMLNTAVENLKREDFFLDQHRRTFQQMIVMGETQQAIDLVTLTDELHRKGELEAAGGAAYLAQLVDGVPKVSNVEHYARIVKEKALLRGLIHSTDVIQQRAFDGESIEELLAYAAIAFNGKVRNESSLIFRTAAQIAQETPSDVDWIAAPWVAAGSITEIAGKVKAAGKTTWVTHLAAAVLDGTKFMSLPTYKTAVVYLTEQPPASFRVALERAHLLNREDLSVLYWKDTLGKPWGAVASSAISECKARGAKLLIVDTIGQFAGIEGDSENAAGHALEAMRPLQQAAAEGIAVIAVRHERKSGGEVGDSGRGSSAFAGAVDVVLSIRRPDGKHRKTLRTIRSLSRFGETPDELVIDFTETGYLALGNSSDVALEEAETTILGNLELIRLNIGVKFETNEYPADLKTLLEGTTVTRATGYRAIKALVASGRVGMRGTGKRGDAFRYFLPEKDSSQTSNTI